MMALRVGIALGGTPIGAPIAGWVANTYGAAMALGVGAASGFARGRHCPRRFGAPGTARLILIPQKKAKQKPALQSARSARMDRDEHPPPNMFRPAKATEPTFAAGTEQQARGMHILGERGR